MYSEGKSASQGVLQGIDRRTVKEARQKEGGEVKEEELLTTKTESYGVEVKGDGSKLLIKSLLSERSIKSSKGVEGRSSGEETTRHDSRIDSRVEEGLGLPPGSLPLESCK